MRNAPCRGNPEETMQTPCTHTQCTAPLKNAKGTQQTPFTHKCQYNRREASTPGYAGKENVKKKKASVLNAPLDQFCGHFGFNWIQKVAHHCAESFEIHWFGNIVAESSFNALVKNVSHDVGRQGDNGHSRVGFVPFPFPNLAAGLVSIFIWHMKVALLPKVR